MNKTFRDISVFLDEFDCIRHNKNMRSYTGIYPKNNKKEIIDHIFISSTLNANGKLKIIKKVDDYTIMYNIYKIKKIYEHNLLTLEYWLNKRFNKDISDHRPVKLELIYNL